MAAFICGTCSVKYENYDELEACVLKHSEFIKNEIKEEPEELLTDNECFAYLTEEVSVKEEVETAPFDEPESVFVKSEETSEYEGQFKKEQFTVSEEKVHQPPQLTKLQIRLKRTTYKCDLCPFRSNWKHSLDAHMKSHEPVNNKLECNLCPYKAKTDCHLVAHLRRHKTQFDCPLCNETFQTYSSFRQHNVVAHSGQTPISCPHCSKGFSTIPEMKQHVKEVHPSAMKYQCSNCQSILANKESYEEHTSSCLPKLSSTHMKTEEKKFHCKLCDVSFKTWSNLCEHDTMAHSDKLSHSCPHCSERFMTRTFVQKHIKESHPAVLEFQCQKCKYVLMTEGKYRKHVYVCSRKVFTCPVCSHDFKYKHHLTQHMKTHEKDL